VIYLCRLIGGIANYCVLCGKITKLKILMRKYSILFFLFIPLFAFSQEEEQPKNWTLNGYVKNLQTASFLRIDQPLFGIDTTLLFQDNLIHNRLNFKWFINKEITFKAEMRNRIFWGDGVKMNPTYGADIEATSNDFFDLSYALIDKDAYVVHSMLDRLYFEYVKNKLEIRLGRQRVNWGINTVWNPNDIFNAYSFTDFDYEERPGSDALRVKYYTGFASSIELAVKAFDNWDEAVAGLLWKTNKWNYDFQLLTGIVNRDLAFGGGWAGNLKTASFKGEFTYFHSLEEDIDNSFAISFGLDYTFKKGLYLATGFLFNSNGVQSGGINQLFSFELSAKNLYPYKYAIFTQTSYPISPLINSGLAIIYSPSEAHALFINPTFTYSIQHNWDLDLVGQLVFNKEDRFYSPTQAIFLRIKYSF